MPDRAAASMAALHSPTRLPAMPAPRHPAWRHPPWRNAPWCQSSGAAARWRWRPAWCRRATSPWRPSDARDGCRARGRSRCPPARSPDAPAAPCHRPAALRPASRYRAKFGHIARPEPEPGQQEQDRAVAPPAWSLGIARRHQPFDRVRLQITRQARQPPALRRRHRPVEIRGGETPMGEVAQIEPKRARHHLGDNAPIVQSGRDRAIRRG